MHPKQDFADCLFATRKVTTFKTLKLLRQDPGAFLLLTIYSSNNLLPVLKTRRELLEVRLALTSVNYHTDI